MSAGEKEEKRGKKRTLDELESNASPPPNPKRRKISPQNNQNVNNGATSKIDDNDNDNDYEMSNNNQNNNDTINSSSNVDNANDHNNTDTNNSTSTNTSNSRINAIKKNKSEKHAKILPNAMPSIKHKHKNHHKDIENENDNDNEHEVIELIDSDSPTTNTSNNDDLITINNETDIEMDDIDNTQNEENDKEEKEEIEVEQGEKGSCSPTAPLSQESNTSNNNNKNKNKNRKISVSTEATIIQPNDDENKYFKYLSIYTDERCLIHAIPDKEILDEFNERPARLQALLDMVKEEKWNSQCRFIPKLDVIPRSEDIEGLHSSGYLADLKNSCSKIYKGNWNCASGSDTYVVRQTFDAALISAGLVIEATKHVYSHIPPLPYSTSLSQTSMDIDNKNNSNKNGVVDNKDDTSSKMDIDNDLNNKNIANDADAHKKSDDKDVKNGNNDIKNGNDNNIEEEHNGEKKPNLDICKTEAIDEPLKKYAVVLNRPPGHHCDGEKYSGYCYINSTAVAIEKQLNQDTKV